jgi:hypothetical protein
MTAKEIADMLCIEAGSVASLITSNRHSAPGVHFRIAEYRKAQGRWARREVVFEASTEPDATRPVVDELKERRKRQAEYRRRNAARINARDRARRSIARGGQAVNPWAQLAHPDLQGYMVRVANNSSMKEAA